MVSREKRTVRGVILLLVLVAGLTAFGNASENGQGPVRFIIIGDRTGDHVPDVYEQIVAEVQRLRPDFIMTVGDQIEGYTDDVARLNSEWAEYKQILSPLTMPLHFTPGNHDILTEVQEGVYREQIGDPYYSFDYCGIHFVILDTGRWERSDELPADQIAWLANDLEKYASAENTIVFMHKPYWYNTTATGKPDTLHTLFRAFGVDAVFTGHFHEYFAGMYNGIKYTCVGSSGGGADPGPTGLQYHFCWVTVDDDGISAVPIKMGSVFPWDELGADDARLASKIKSMSFAFEPMMVGGDLRPVDGRVTLRIHNFSPDKDIDDTLRWELTDNWEITPSILPVKVEADKAQLVEFQAVSKGALYPAPTAGLQFEFAEGKKADISAPLRITRKITCTRVAMPPMIDGNIAEPIWKNPETRFFAPDGGPMTVDPVAFYFAYDDKNLYVAARCKETVMDSLAASVVDHDGPIYTEDCIGLFIQPNMENKTAYQIYFNPLGLAFDQRLTMQDDGYMAGDRGWDGNYDVKALHGADFWTIEAAIPLGQLGGSGKPGKKIGLNFRRKQARLGSSADWQAPIDYNPDAFGILIME